MSITKNYNISSAYIVINYTIEHENQRQYPYPSIYFYLIKKKWAYEPTAGWL